MQTNLHEYMSRDPHCLWRPVSFALGILTLPNRPRTTIEDILTSLAWVPLTISMASFTRVQMSIRNVTRKLNRPSSPQLKLKWLDFPYALGSYSEKYVCRITVAYYRVNGYAVARTELDGGRVMTSPLLEKWSDSYLIVT